MNDPILGKVLDATRRSAFLEAAASVQCDGGQALALGRARLRPLSEQEIARLEGQGNSAEDWSCVRVAEAFDWRRVRDSSFHGDVILGAFRGRTPVGDGVQLPAGIYRSTIVNCVIGHDALLCDVTLLANYVVGPAAVLLDCGRVVCDAPSSFGNGIALPLGIESGGRDVHVYAEIDVAVADAVARSRGRSWFLRNYARAVADYVTRARSQSGIIERRAAVCHTATVRNTYLGPHAVVDGAALVADSTLLSAADEPVRVESGACVTGSLLQWGCRVGTTALVDRSVLTEYSQAERHAQVTTSLLGPNTVVAGGEVTASLLGPFVGFHHQALLIATLWPEGKGNVGAGANAGSNHTSKAPDQEFWLGEGVFLGLGVNIKFPADLSRAPYSILAAGVSTLPQKVTFPFSLVTTPASRPPNVGTAFNEIIPAWLLTDNLFMLKRNEAKYRARNRARRSASEFAVFRPAIVDLMRDACGRLEAVQEIRDVYTERDIPGLGKNFLRETARQAALAAYRFYIRYYALLGLLECTRAALRAGRPDVVPLLLSASSEDPRWEHQRRLLIESLGVTNVVSGLCELPPVLETVARAVERSKARDDERGPSIIDDYADVHLPASEDPFVRQVWQETEQLQHDVAEVLFRLDSRRLLREAPPYPREDSPQPVAGLDGSGEPASAAIRDLLRSA